MSKKVLVVGSQGYLGSRLTEYLNERGYQCSGIDTGFFEGGKLTTPEQISTVKKDARSITENDLDKYLYQHDKVEQMSCILLSY